MSYEDKKSQENPPVKEDSLGLNREERWQLIQYFNDLIKHGDSKIQMLLTVQGVIVAAYGGFISTFLSKPNIWNPVTIFFKRIICYICRCIFAGRHSCPATVRQGAQRRTCYA